MRALLVLAYAANLLLDAIGWLAHPGRVAVHFGPGGGADGWGSSGVQALSMGALHTLLFLVFLLLPGWVPRVPACWVNLPHRDYWLAPERRGACRARLQALLHRFGVVLFLFLLAAGSLTLQAQEVRPPRLDERMFLLALGLFLAYLAAWLVAFWRAFRLPARPEGAGG